MLGYVMLSYLMLHHIMLFYATFFHKSLVSFQSSGNFLAWDGQRGMVEDVREGVEGGKIIMVLMVHEEANAAKVVAARGELDNRTRSGFIHDFKMESAKEPHIYHRI